MKWIAVVLLLMPLLCKSQVTFPDSTKLKYEKVIKVDSLTADQLYMKLRSWVAKTYNSANDVIQMDDKANHLIIGKGQIRYDPKVYIGSDGTRGYISYTIQLEMKDGRYRYIIYDFIHEGSNKSYGDYSFLLITTDEECPYKIHSGISKSWKNKVWKDIKSRIDFEAKFIEESLNKYIKEPSDNNANW